jgi:hypothetical protein
LGSKNSKVDSTQSQSISKKEQKENCMLENNNDNKDNRIKPNPFSPQYPALPRLKIVIYV